ncbi:MAG: metal-sensitive transcriptional regulator [Phycisphaerales bacterium]|nr:metal-sensitive transcriptional regulator [Phycisphaerales bacterium]
MKKRDAAKRGRGGKGAAAASDRGAAACCGCGVAAGLEAARDGVGPGAHASGVDAAIKSANLKHLRRIEGQVRGIAAMIEDDRYCADIIQQCAAVQESLRSVAKNLLRNHLSHCANHAMHGDKDQQAAMVEEIVELVGRIAR